jgi:hypothetical protein
MKCSWSESLRVVQTSHEERKSVLDIVPYSFNVATLPQVPRLVTMPGQAQGVYIILPDDYQFILSKVMSWFAGRDEVELVDHGVSDKVGLGYIIMEWSECDVDPLFLAILRDEESVADYTVYTRDL